MTKFFAIRQHEIHAGHRVYGHANKCQSLHGHSFVIHFHCQAVELDNLGMVVDFGIIKSTLCKWLDDNYDHRMLIWQNDSIATQLMAIDDKVVLVPYNPTAENIANYLLTVVAPSLLDGNAITVTKVVVEETTKCRAEVSL